MKVIGVRFKSTKKIYYFNPNGFDVKKDDNVIVETARGIEFGETVIGIRDVPESEIVQPLQNVIRIATPEDVKTVQTNEEKQKEAFEKCQQKIKKHQLDMKLVDAEYTFDGTKLIFYFTSDGRVDFRDLVKDLAVMFKTRIELRQIAVRDETKMLGGLGACGNEICCKRFLGDFASVSIKMAKEQNLSLNPTKISGLCGRLICCLNFEKDFYNEMNDKLPSLDEIVMSPKGSAQIVATYPLKESVRVKYTNPDGSTDTAIFHLNEITRTNPCKRKSNDENNELFDNYLSPEELASLDNDSSEENSVSVIAKPKHKTSQKHNSTDNLSEKTDSSISANENAYANHQNRPSNNKAYKKSKNNNNNIKHNESLGQDGKKEIKSQEHKHDDVQDKSDNNSKSSKSNHKKKHNVNKKTDSYAESNSSQKSELQSKNNINKNHSEQSQNPNHKSKKKKSNSSNHTANDSDKSLPNTEKRIKNPVKNIKIQDRSANIKPQDSVIDYNSQQHN